MVDGGRQLATLQFQIMHVSKRPVSLARDVITIYVMHSGACQVVKLALISAS